MLLVIAPSKTQNSSGPETFKTTQPLFLHESESLIRELRNIPIEDLAKLMKMSESLALQTFRRIKDFQIPFTTENSSPALMTFQGDVYSRIDRKAYGQEEFEYLQNHLCILSGLYGILRPLDLMQPYRLEMGCKLANKRGKNLYDFWTEFVTDAINQMLGHQNDPIVVNLASNEYIRVIKRKKLKGSMLQIDFKESKGESYKTVAIYAKRARGMMVDFAVKNKIEKVEELKIFKSDNYVFNADLSTDMHYVFVR